MPTLTPDQLRQTIATRRNFAIISHPDAGKTTLTEKVLLYGGAIHLAGSVKPRKKGPQATSDWMELERQRGISISTSVLQFDYRGRRINLLDTPGHNDFSEDTYRTLSAADCAVMLIDCAKGVEPQTLKLFEVCRMRHIPIITFVNKLDRPGKPPFDVLDEVEKALGIPCSAVDWPIGAARSFLGVYDRWKQVALRFERPERAGERAPMHASSLEDPAFLRALEEHAAAAGELAQDVLGRLRDELELLDTAGNAFDMQRFLAGELTPVFFGSAMTNFGIEPFLDHFVELAPPPRTRATSTGPLAADAPRFTGFVFKIQANMDPRHRDRVAFLRVCSGRFERGMSVLHVRSGKQLTLSRPLQFLAQERTMIEEAYSGDIIGLWDPGVLRIGDTLCEGAPLEFAGIPRFSPQHFVRVRFTDPQKRKQLNKGLEQLSEEGAVQMFFDRKRGGREPILGAVGQLQFEVIQHRLQSEYGVEVEFEPLPYQIARWIEQPTAESATEPLDLGRFERAGRSTCVLDVEERPLVLFDSEWALRMFREDWPQVGLVAAVQPGRRGS